MCLCLITLTVKNFFLNLLSFSWNPLLLVLLQHTLSKSPSTALLQDSFRNWKAALRFPLETSPGWTVPTLSACLRRRVAPALWLLEHQSEMKRGKDYTMYKVLPHSAWLRMHLLQTTREISNGRKTVCPVRQTVWGLQIAQPFEGSKLCVWWFLLNKDQNLNQTPLLKKIRGKKINFLRFCNQYFCNGKF